MSARGVAMRAGRLAAVAALAAGALLAPRAARAQSVEGEAGSYTVLRRLSYRGAVFDQSGPAYGAAGSLQVGPVRIGASGWSASLSPDGGLPNTGVRVRTTAVTLHVALNPALLVGVREETRRFSSPAGVTLWQMKGVDVLFEPDFGIPGLRGVAEVAALGASAVRGGPNLNVAVQTTMGMTYAFAGGPLRVRLAYRFERYDVAITPPEPQRFDQFRGLMLDVGVRLGR